jgi:hypothetical protein
MTERKKLLLRLDPDVYAAIARWAADDLRSVNAQIEYALRRALEAAGRAPRRATPAQDDAEAHDGSEAGDGGEARRGAEAGEGGEAGEGEP